MVGHYSDGERPGTAASIRYPSGLSIDSFFCLRNGFRQSSRFSSSSTGGSSFFHPVGISAVSRTYQGPKLQNAMAFQSSFGNLGVLLVFLTAAPLYLALGWRSTFLVFAAWTIADVVITLLTLRKAPNRLSGEPDRSSTNAVRPRRFTIPVFFVAVAFISGGSYAVILNFANIFLGTQAHLGVSESNLVGSAFIAAAFLGAISTGLWKRPLGPGSICRYLF